MKFAFSVVVVVAATATATATAAAATSSRQVNRRPKAYHTWVLVVAFCLINQSLTKLVASEDDNSKLSAKCQTASTTRINCHPEPGSNEQECTRRNCCWLPDADDNDDNGRNSTHTKDKSRDLPPPFVRQPNCFFPSDFSCYDLIELPQQKQNRKEGDPTRDETIKGTGKFASSKGASGDSTGYKQNQQVDVFRWMLIRSNKCPASGFTDDATKLVLEVGVYGDSLINIKISEPDRPERFVPSLPEIKLPVKSNNYDYFNRKNNDRVSEWEQSNAQALNYDSNSGGGDDGGNDELVGKPETLKRKRLTIRRLVAIELEPASAAATTTTTTTTIAGENYDQPQTAAGVLKVIHQISGAILFQLDLGKLIYSRQFIQLPTYLAPSSLIYGLGQHMGDSLLKSSANGKDYAKSYSMFNYGHPPQADGRSAYSSYPFYINLAQLNKEQPQVNGNEEKEEQKKAEFGWQQSSILNFEQERKLIATGGLMLNSGPMDVVISGNSADNEPKQQHETCLTWRLISGIVDLYLFMGPKPHDVVAQYQSLVATPSVPPAWSLGYHQSRHNYMGLMQIKLAWAKARSAGIPVESIWTDIDFLWRATSYTVNDRELNELVKTLQKEYDMHYVPIVDPAISIKEEFDIYKPLELAKRLRMFATNPDDSIASTTTWTESRKSGLIDFTHTDAVYYLIQVLSDYKDKLNYDGLWLDMNEPEVFLNAENSEGERCALDEKLPYLPANRNPLHDKTLCMAAKFELGKHLDLHNLYAFYHSKAHYEALKALNPTKRPFILSRSQFVGQGKYSGTWLGDLASTFEHMQWSLLGMIESNWFGQPLVGADICGFFGSTTDELCARWFSLGAFYPFSRNHNHGSARDQDPGSLGEIVQLSARIALVRRYSLLPYLYTLFYDNHFKNLPVIRSVLFESFDQFMTDIELTDLPQIDDQFMWGSALMFAPVMKSGTHSRSVYFPPGKWYDLSIGLPGTNTDEGVYDALSSNWPPSVLSSDNDEDKKSRLRLEGLRKSIECRNITGCRIEDVFTPVGATNIYLKGGQIIPTFRHVNHENSVGTSWKNAAFFLEAALDADNGAFGSLFWDGGESEVVSGGANNQAIFYVQDNKLLIIAIDDRYEEPLKFDGFVVYGVKSLNGQIPENQVYKGVRLVYDYQANTESLSCLFKSPSRDDSAQLTLKRFERLQFKW